MAYFYVFEEEKEHFSDEIDIFEKSMLPIKAKITGLINSVDHSKTKLEQCINSDRISLPILHKKLDTMTSNLKALCSGYELYKNSILELTFLNQPRYLSVSNTFLDYIDSLEDFITDIESEYKLTSAPVIARSGSDISMATSRTPSLQENTQLPNIPLQELR